MTDQPIFFVTDGETVVLRTSDLNDATAMVRFRRGFYKPEWQHLVELIRGTSLTYTVEAADQMCSSLDG